MAREVVTTGVLRLDTQSAEKTIAALDRQIDDLFAKAKKGGGVGPLFGGGRGGRRGGGTPAPDAAKLQKTLDLQTRINTLMREAGVTYGTASTVARAYGDSMDGAGDDALAFARKLDKAKRETAELSKKNRVATGFFGKLTTSVFAGVAAFASLTAILSGVRRALSATYDRYVALEGATVSLRKVTDLDDAAFDRLKTRLENLSASSVPVATEQLLNLGAAAAQMGIQSAEGIALAAETGAQLAQATDIQAEEAVKGLTRILAIQGEAVDNLDNLGSALVELGNTSRATESEIAPIANEIARATANFDIASPVILGYAAALAEMGAKAEGSGTALAMLFNALLVAGKTGKNLQAFADVAGVSADRLRELVSEDISLAAQVFLAGLGRYGEDGVVVLDKLGLSSQRVAKALLPLAANAERLQDRIELSNRAFGENTALSEEAGSAFDQLSADATRAWNAIGLLATDAFEPLARVLSVVLRWIAETIVGFREMATETAPLREAIGAELVGALLAFNRLFDSRKSSIYFEAIQQGSRDTLSTFLELIPGIEKTDFNLGSLAEKFIELGGFEGMILTIVGTLYELAAAAARTGGEIASGILSGISHALDGLADLAQSIRNIPIVGEALGPAADGVAESIRSAAESVTRLSKDAAGAGEVIAESLDDKAAKAFNRAIDVSNRKIAALREATKDLKEEGGEDGLIPPPPDPEPFEEVDEAIAKINQEIAQARDTFLVMQQFGVDADVARDAVKLLADAEGLSTEAAVELAQSLHGARDAVSDLARERKALDDFRKSIEDINREAELVAQGLTLQDAADAIRLMESAGVDAATAISMLRERTAAEMALTQAAFDAGRISVEQYMQAMLSPAEFEQWRKNQQDTARILDNLKTKVDKYAEEIARINELFASGDLTEAQRDAALKSLRDQQEGWVRVAAAAADAAASTQGAWSKVFSSLSDNMESLVGAFSQLSGVLMAAGEQQAGLLAQAAGQFAAGDTAGGVVSLVGASGLGAGNFMQEGAAIGAEFGPWGAVIGGAIGSMINKGADDFHSELTEASGKAVLSISQAEGELAKLAPEIKGVVEGFLNDLQASVLADLDLTGVGAEFHIRGTDRFRVRLEGGMEQIFDNMEEAMGFFLRGVLQTNASVEGLGDTVRAFFEGASVFAENLGDLERLQQGLELAQRLDFMETGVDPRVINSRREEWELMREFRLPYEKLVALRRQELDVTRASIAASAQSFLGATVAAGSVVDLARSMQVFNATTQAQIDADRARAAELEQLIGVQEEQTAAATEAAQASESALVATNRSRDSMVGFGNAMEGSRREFDESRREMLEGTRQLDEYQKELDALNESLAVPPELFDTEEIGKLWEKAMADMGLSLLDMIEAVEGPTATMEKRRELQNVIFMLQLDAQIRAAQLVLQTVEFVSEASRAMFAGLVDDATQLFNDLASGAKSLPADLGGTGGAGRRKAAAEEAERAAEQAAQRLDDFTAALYLMELGTKTTLGTLGEFARRLDEIAETARQAAKDGAETADLWRFQQLAFRDVREDVLAPFGEGRRESFTAASIDIEQQRREGIEQARLLAEAQAEAMGVSFESIFDPMTEVIDRWAQRTQDALTRGVIDALDLPLEQTRRQMQEFRRATRDLDQAFARGEISERRYLSLQKQIQAQQEAAVGGQALSLLDKYYDNVEGREQLRRDLERMNFELELANLRLRFDMLVAENALAEDAVGRIGGLITFMEQNPPDWEAFFAVPGADLPGAGTAFRGGGGGGVSTASIASDFSNLADAMRDFLHSFNQLDVGQFTAQAREWIYALDGFEKDVQEAIRDNSLAAQQLRQASNVLFGVTDITQLTAEQLEQVFASISEANIYYDQISDLVDILQAAQDLGDVSTLGPERILNMYEDTIEATSELAGKYAAINAEYLDAVNALQELGATAEQLTRAEEIHQARISQFLQEALSGFRSLSKELRGGSFGGVNVRTQIEAAQARANELRRRIAADPLDFEAIQDLEAELRNILALQEDFTGGVGPEFNRIVAEILGISDQIQAQVGAAGGGDTFTPADPGVLMRMDEQSVVFAEIRDTIDQMNESAAISQSQIARLAEQNAALLKRLTPRSGQLMVN